MDQPSHTARSVLYFPSLIFEGIIRLRNRAYSLGLIASQKLPAPVISVGNITLGGTGKTPFVIAVLQLLAKMEQVPALLSRGYGRDHADQMHILAPGSGGRFPANQLGDEPSLIRRHAPQAWLGICADRHKAAGQILSQCPNPVFVLDDGFQHRQLKRDLDIVLIDAAQSLTQNDLFPLGTLREPVCALGRAHAIILNVSKGKDAQNFDLETIRAVNPGAAIFHCQQKIALLVPFHLWCKGEATDAQRPKTAYLLAAIGNPRRFQKDVESLGIQVKGAHFKRDHRTVDPDEWASLQKEALAAGADAVIMTEKDAVKFSQHPDFPLLVAVQETFVEEKESFEGFFRTRLEESRAHAVSR
jgi:tetraacyldisaccharide 4'-kinase